MSEKQYVLNMIKQFAKPGAIFAVVADSYNIYDFCSMVGSDPDIKSAIDSHGLTGGFVVIRPDSGDPSTVVVKCMYILEKYFGSIKNTKGYRVLNNVRVIQGDGIDHASIQSILFCMDLAGFSADNIAFGQGGALLQQVNRDTMRFAMKCSSIGIRVTEGSGLSSIEWRDVYKDPVTDSGKKSKRGKVSLWDNGAGEYQTSVSQPMNWSDKGFSWQETLVDVFRNGILVKEYTFDEVRANSRKYII